MPSAAPANRPRTHVRTRPRARSWRLFLLLAPPVVLVAAVVAFFGVRAWIYSFLRGDDFRHFLDRKASVVLRAEGRFEPLHWQDTEVYSDAFDATGGASSPATRLIAEQVRARLDLHAVWNHVWRVESLEAEKFTATLGSLHPDLTDAEAASEVTPAIRPGAGPDAGFLAGWLPSKVQIDEVRINDFSLAWNAGQVTGTRVRAHPREGNGGLQNWEIDGTGGRLEAASLPVVRLASFNVKAGPHEIFLTRAEGQPETGGRIDLSGRQALDADRALDLTANFEGIPITEFLPPDWRARLHGNATGAVHVTGSASAPDRWHARGHVDLRDGRLEALPMLDQLATFTATERYRQAPLQKSHADFDWTPAGVTVSNLLVESEGLLKIEGGFTVRGDQIDGTLQVGIARNSLRWIAALGAQVFNLPEHDGYVWTTTHLKGPVRHPSEDLSPRLIAAAQQQVIDKAKQGADTILDTAGSLLDLLKK